jgi:hypothetical protein
VAGGSAAALASRRPCLAARRPVLAQSLQPCAMRPFQGLPGPIRPRRVRGLSRRRSRLRVRRFPLNRYPDPPPHEEAEIRLRAALDQLRPELATSPQPSFCTDDATRASARLSERMMGLEPTTFCMANASRRSHPFAPVRSNRLFAGPSVRTSERFRTRANAEPCHPCHGLEKPGHVIPARRVVAERGGLLGRRMPSGPAWFLQ